MVVTDINGNGVGDDADGDINNDIKHAKYLALAVKLSHFPITAVLSEVLALLAEMHQVHSTCGGRHSLNHNLGALTGVQGNQVHCKMICTRIQAPPSSMNH